MKQLTHALCYVGIAIGTSINKLSLFNFTSWFVLMSIVTLSPGCGPKAETIAQKVVQPVNPDYFIADSLVEPIKKEMRTLSDGSQAECYVITAKSFPSDHPIGPWAPTTSPPTRTSQTCSMPPTPMPGSSGRPASCMTIWC